MTITAQMVKDLRDSTGAGMMDAKKALEENAGDMQKAVDWLRQKGMAKAAKKSGRAAAEGIVWAVSNGKTGVMVEINSETDFSARNEQFSGFVKAVADAALKAGKGDVDGIKALKMPSGETVEAALTNLVATVGENMQLRRAAMLESKTGNVGAYVHMGGKIGVLVSVEGADVGEVARQVAMHVAASNPAALDRDSIDQDLLAREKAIYEAQAAESGKPAPVVQKIVEGRVNKYLEEVCLVEQPFVMDTDRKVGKVVSDAKAGAKVSGFVRFALGEGVEKEVTDFAAEVAAQVAASA
ncbi:MAG: elongation factor Ts [Proteobacteria bacterium]|nr:elongation factor Ts [Pseudomonadota bacterium]